MAATVTGAFVVLDRASRPIRRIRDEAIQADLAVTKLGKSLDNVGTREQRQMMENTTSQIRQLAGDSRGAATEAENLGQKVEKIATPQNTRNIATQAGAIKQTERAARDANRPISDLTRGTRRLGDESRTLSDRLGKLGGSMLGMRAVLMGALIPAIGLAVQGVSALGGGLVALLPRLTQLSGMAAPAGTAVVGIGLAAITAKLAFNDLGKAMSGNQKALKALTPEARSFMRTLKEYQPLVQQMRQSAQRGLFPGLETAVRRMAAAAPIVNQMLTQMGQRMGSLAAEAARQFTGTGFLRDFQLIGNEGMHIVTQMGRGLLNLVQAVRNFLVAGLPFTHWLTDTLYGFTEYVRRSSDVARSTGRLATFFDHARSSLTVMGHVVRNVFEVMHGVMQAATSTGNDLWDSIDKVTRRWADWTNSTRGQNDMRRYFQSIRAPLHEIVGFVGDLTKGLAHMATGSGFTRAMESLRQAIPSLAQGLSTIASSLGPRLMEALSQTLQLASTLVGGAGGEGPLMMALDAFNGILKAVNSLTRHIPGLGMALGAALTVVGINALIAKIRGLAEAWFGVAAGASAAAKAEGEAAVAGDLAGGRGGLMRRGGRGAPGGGGFLSRPSWGQGGGERGPGIFSRARGRYQRARSPLGMAANEIDEVAGMGFDPRMVARGPGALTAAGLRGRVGGLGRGVGRGVAAVGRRGLSTFARGASWGMADLGPGLFTGLRGAAGGLLRGGGGLLGRAGGMGLRGLGAAAEFMAPIAMLSGIMGAIGQHTTRGGGAGIGQRVAGFADSATFGLTKGLTHRNEMFTSAAQFDQRSFRGVGAGVNRAIAAHGGADPTLKQAQWQVDYLRRMRQDYSTETSRTGRQMYAQLGRLFDQSKRGLMQKASETGITLAQGFGQAFNVYSRREGIHKAMDDTAKDVTRKMRMLGPQGARALGQNMIEWAREQARANPKLWGEVRTLQSRIKKQFDDMGQHVKIVNGQILTGSQTQWAQIATSMTDPVEQAKEKMSTNFTAIQREAVAALTMMGYSQTDATNLVTAVEKGGHGAAIAQRVASGKTTSAANKASIGVSRGTAGAVRRGGASGGRITGMGVSDNVRVGPNAWAAPGELIVNHWTEHDVNRDLVMAGKPPLGSRVGRESRRHNMATGDRNQRGNMAGVQQQAAMRTTGGLQPGVSAVVQRILGQYPGLSITSTTGGGHAANSYHYRGMAADLGGSPQLMNQAAAWIGRTMGASLLEGIHNPNLSIKNGHRVASSFWGPTVWGEHANHIHVAAGGGAMRGLPGGGGGAVGGVGAAPQITLAGWESGRLGVPSALLARGSNLYAQALQGKINKALAAGGGGGGAPTRGTMSFNAVAKLAESVGLPGVAFAQIAKGESGFNPMAVGHDPGGTQGLGLWQITTKYNDDIIKRFGGRNAMFNAHTNALAAKAIYDRAGIGAWYGTRYLTDPTAHYRGAKGMRVPGFGGWFAAGGRGSYRKPTYIGVGDAHTPEQVDVTPIRHQAGQGSNTGGGKHVVINVHPGAIVIHGADAKAGRDAADAFIDRLTSVIGGMGMESEADIS